MDWYLFNPFPNKPGFLRVCSASLLKNLWEKDKLFVRSNFSFFPQCFLSTLLENFPPFPSNLKVSTANSFWKGLSIVKKKSLFYIHLAHHKPQAIIFCFYLMKCYAMEKGGLMDIFIMDQ